MKMNIFVTYGLILFLILSLSLVATAVSVQKEDVNVSSYCPKLWVVSPMLKIHMDDEPIAKSEMVIDLAASRGEYEHSQICLRSDRVLKDLKVELSDLKSKDEAGAISSKNLSWRQVGYVYCKEVTEDSQPSRLNIEPGWWPDPLLEVERFDLDPNVTQPIWITVYVPKGTNSGSYQGVVRLVIGEEILAQIPITLEVWPLDIPWPGKVKTAFSFFYTYPGAKDTEEFNFMDKIYGKFTPEIRDRYFDFLAKHRIPADMLYLKKQPRPVEDYELCIKEGALNQNLLYVTEKPEDINSTIKKLEPLVEEFKRKGLIRYFYVYGFDEKKKSIIPVLSKVFGAIKQRWPELRTMAVPGNWAPVPNMPIDIWVCNFNCEIPDGKKRWIDSGKEYWWYHSCTPYKLNSFVEWPAIHIRLIMWMAAKERIDGYLYYCGDLWNHSGGLRKIVKMIGPGPRINFDPATYKHYNGDGSLYYPGPKGPLSSIRLENFTDGFEDWEMFIQLRKKALKTGKTDVAESLIRKLIRNKDDFTVDPELLEKTRRQAATELISLSDNETLGKLCK